GTLVGHGTIRNSVMGQVDGAPTAEELARMRQSVRDNVKAGAVGMSSGLYYAPGSFAKPDEMIAMCGELAAFDAVYTSHIRDEGDFLLESIDEAISTAKTAGVILQISHLKSQYPRNYSKISDALSKIENARSEGVRVLADRYPYNASSTSLGSFFPRWSQKGTTEDFVNLLAGKERERELRDHLSKQEEKLQSWGNVVISSVITDKNRHMEGKSVFDAAAESKKPCFEFIRDLLIEEKNQVAMINFSMSEENLKLVLAHPHVVVGSDGNALAPYGVLGKGKPHPRSYGTFVRVLGKYVREENVLTLPAAIMKMTSLPAGQFGLLGRGMVKEGYYADLAVFDPDTVIDIADWLNPHQYPAGMEYVIVNGSIVINSGENTGQLPGHILKHNTV
ncbi:amidohydrolase family protein, partial [Candidatus Latescibacterota bacterium]